MRAGVAESIHFLRLFTRVTSVMNDPANRSNRWQSSRGQVSSLVFLQLNLQGEDFARTLH